MITIVWDIDDVLNDLMRIWFETWWLPTHHDCKLTYQNIRENPPHRLLSSSIKKYLDSLDDFRRSKNYEEMQPNPAIIGWFHRYGHLCHHIALTSVPRKAAHISASWVLRHFGDWIRTFHFVPSSRAGEYLPCYETEKSEYIQKLKQADVFIDDNPANIRSTIPMGIKCFMVSRPWNHGGTPLYKILDHLRNMALKNENKTE
jgi:5'(3')-deoxyribonucleotidase